MNYVLKHFDIPLIRFHASEDSRNPEITIQWINKESSCLLPLDLGEASEEHISKWLRDAQYPKTERFRGLSLRNVDSAQIGL